jgi:hypothetical protein
MAQRRQLLVYRLPFRYQQGYGLLPQFLGLA